MSRTKKEKKYTLEFKKLQYDNNEFSGIWIPKSVMFIDELNDLEQKVLMVIKQFCKNDKPFYGGNEYLRKYMGVSKGRISQVISYLTELGLIKIEITKKADKYGEIKTERLIYITNLGKIITSNDYFLYEISLIDLTESLIDLTGSLIDWEYNSIINIILNNNSILKNTISDSEESRSDSLNDSDLRDALKKKMNKDKPLKKQKKIPSLTDEEKESEKFFEYWVNKELTREHKKGTKLYVKCLKYFTELKSGIFSAGKEFDKKSLQMNNIDLKSMNKKWNDADIYKALDNMHLYLIEGYWPHDKEKLKNMGLDTLLFNSSTKKSWFINAYFNPPKKIQFEEKKRISSNENLYNIVREFFGENLDPRKENKLIEITNRLFKHMDKWYEINEPITRHIAFDSWLGSKNRPEVLINALVDYHKKHNQERVVEKFDINNLTWKNFLKEIERVHGLVFEPNEKQRQALQRDYESYLRRKKSRA